MKAAGSRLQGAYVYRVQGLYIGFWVSVRGFRCSGAPSHLDPGFFSHWAVR